MLLAQTKLRPGLFGLLLLLLGLAKIASLPQCAAQTYDSYPAGVSAAYLLRLRGFIADEFSVVTNSGYVLRVTRGRNPLFAQPSADCQVPILFIHGLDAAANNFLLNSHNVTPKDLSGLDFNSMSLDQVKTALAKEPSARSLGFLALNRGCVIWLLERRGAPGSQQRIGDPLSVPSTPTNGTSNQSTPASSSSIGSFLNSAAGLLNVTETLQSVLFTLDYSYWNYSLTEQAQDDFPVTINFVLSNSPGATQVSVVGHSAGGAITLMGLSLMTAEERANISVAILWAPAYATSNNNPKFDLLFTPVVPIVSTYVGPLLVPPFLVDPVISSIQVACTPPITWTTTCELAYDQIFGNSGGQQPTTPQIANLGPYSAASYEFGQLSQTIFFPPNHTIRYFDYGPVGNLAQYGRLSPPAFSLSDIGNSPKLSFWAGLTDFLVTPDDVLKSRAQLTVQSKYHLVNTTFNHIGYFNHIQNALLVIIESMYELQTLANS